MPPDDQPAPTRLDAAADRAFDRLRGRAWADGSAVAISNLADYGFVWSLVAATKGRRRTPARRQAVRALAASGVLSAGVNATVKFLVQRQRPPAGPDSEDGSAAPGRALPVRLPTSSSFPSGHTLAAFCAAMVMADSKTERVAYTTFATLVGASRVHLRAHHASDVIGGAAIGTVLGLAARRVLRH
jgi:membrane-associated phospholipid phosphatase